MAKLFLAMALICSSTVVAREGCDDCSYHRARALLQTKSSNGLVPSESIPTPPSPKMTKPPAILGLAAAKAKTQPPALKKITKPPKILAFAAKAKASGSGIQKLPRSPAGGKLLHMSKAKRALNLKSTKALGTDLDSYKVLEGFAETLALQNSSLSAEQMAIIAELNKTLYEETLPILYERHQNDQMLLQQHAAAVATCNSNLEVAAATVNGLKDASDTATATEVDCKSTEATLLDAKEQAMTIMTNFLETTSDSCGSMPDNRQPSTEMDMWVMCNLEFYNGFNATYYAYKAAARAAESAYELMSANCSVLMSTAAEKLCSWSEELGLVQSDYERCRSETVALFEQTSASAMDNMQGRKSDYSALVKVQCYLQVLMGGDISVAANIHTVCDNAAVHMHAFDIMVPDLAPYAAETLGSMGSPIASCDESAYDGESAYGESGYDESAYDESAAGGSSTSAAPYQTYESLADYCEGKALLADKVASGVPCADPGVYNMLTNPDEYEEGMTDGLLEWWQMECCGAQTYESLEDYCEGKALLADKVASGVPCADPGVYNMLTNPDEYGEGTTDGLLEWWQMECCGAQT